MVKKQNTRRKGKKKKRGGGDGGGAFPSEEWQMSQYHPNGLYPFSLVRHPTGPLLVELEHLGIVGR